MFKNVLGSNNTFSKILRIGNSHPVPIKWIVLFTEKDLFRHNLVK